MTMRDGQELDPGARLDRLIEARRAGQPPGSDEGDLAALADLALALERHWAQAPALDPAALWERVATEHAHGRRSPRGLLLALGRAVRLTPLTARAALGAGAAMLAGLALLLATLAVQDGRSEAAFVQDLRGLSGFTARALTDQQLTSGEQAEVGRRALALARAVEAEPDTLSQLDGAQLAEAATALDGIAQRLAPLAAGQPGVSTSVESLAVLAARIEGARQALQPSTGQPAVMQPGRGRGGDDDAPRKDGTPGQRGGAQAAAPPAATSQARPATPAPVAPAAAPPPAAAATVPAAAGALAEAFAFCAEGSGSNAAGCQRALERAAEACARGTSGAAPSRSALGRCEEALDAARRACDRLPSRAEDSCRRRLTTLRNEARTTGTPKPGATPTRTARPGGSGEDGGPDGD
jgi:hypothetical protein